MEFDIVSGGGSTKEEWNPNGECRRHDRQQRHPTQNETRSVERALSIQVRHYQRGFFHHRAAADVHVRTTIQSAPINRRVSSFPSRTLANLRRFNTAAIAVKWESTSVLALGWNRPRRLEEPVPKRPGPGSSSLRNKVPTAGLSCTRRFQRLQRSLPSLPACMSAN